MYRVASKLALPCDPSTQSADAGVEVFILTVALRRQAEVKGHLLAEPFRLLGKAWRWFLSPTRKPGCGGKVDLCKRKALKHFLRRSTGFKLVAFLFWMVVCQRVLVHETLAEVLVGGLFREVKKEKLQFFSQCEWKSCWYFVFCLILALDDLCSLLPWEKGIDFLTKTTTPFPRAGSDEVDPVFFDPS